MSNLEIRKNLFELIKNEPGLKDYIHSFGPNYTNMATAFLVYLTKKYYSDVAI